MTPQRPNAHPDLHQAAPPPAHPDARIDHVLEALRTATPPAGLEQRIAARLAQAAEARQSSAPQPRPFITTDIAADHSILTTILNAARSLLAVISTGARSAKWKDPRIPLAPAQIYTAAAALTLLLTVTTITLVHHRTPTTTAHTHINQTTTTAALTSTSTPGLEGAGLQSRHNTPTNPPALAASTTTLVSTPCFEGAALQSRRNTPPCTAALAAERISSRPPQQPSLDTIALAETRAPSRPAPPMPLTAQEHLLLAAARPGQPIEVAELDMARAPNLRAAAEYREDARIRRYVKGLLASFAVADALSPTTSQTQEISTTAPAPQPLSSLTD